MDQTSLPPHKRHISPAIWFSVIVILAFGVGYMAWAKSNSSWPFDGTIFPYPERKEQTSNPNAPSDWKTYRNEQYGFMLSFPESWKGYSVKEESWNGEVIGANAERIENKTGPQIVIRHPKWTKKNPWQDIPIMVFTRDEWKMTQPGTKATLSVSAAPVGPAELGRNNKFVFALPPRWVGFYDNLGQDEAVEITETFKAF